MFCKTTFTKFFPSNSLGRNRAGAVAWCAVGCSGITGADSCRSGPCAEDTRVTLRREALSRTPENVRECGKSGEGPRHYTPQ